MARQARKKSNSGIYHIMIRGIGKQILFEEDADRRYFLYFLQKYRTEEDILLHGYCLMENHVHLLIQDPNEKMDLFMKKLEGRYAFYYNRKYERVGPMFQGRFKSEPVDSDAYYMCALRYILRNPEKAGLCAHNTYPWSSYRDYFEEGGITNTEFALKLFGDTAVLREFLTQETDDSCLESQPQRPGENRAAEILRATLGVKSGAVLQGYERKQRDEAVCKLKAAGLSVRQIERLTGLNRGIIQKANCQGGRVR